MAHDWAAATTPCPHHPDRVHYDDPLFGPKCCDVRTGMNYLCAAQDRNAIVAPGGWCAPSPTYTAALDNDRSTMYHSTQAHDFDAPTEAKAGDVLGPLDYVVAELDDAMEGLERTLAPLLRGAGMSLAAETVTAEKTGTDDRSEVRKRVMANVARLERITAGVRDLRERVDL